MGDTNSDAQNGRTRRDCRGHSVSRFRARFVHHRRHTPSGWRLGARTVLNESLTTHRLNDIVPRPGYTITRRKILMTRLKFVLGLGLLAITVVACKYSASTANLSSLKLGK